MAEIFLTIEVAAELEELNYETMKKKIQRNPSLKIKMEKQSNGGRDCTYIALSSLSKKAKVKYRKKKKMESEANQDQPEINKAPWYTEVDVNWYMETFKSAYYKATDLAIDIKAFLEYNEAARTSFAGEFAETIAISQRTLYRYAESYLEAESWALEFSKGNGRNYDYFKVLALCRKPKSSNTFPSLTEEHRSFIENLWFNREFARNLGTVEMLFTQFEKHFKDKKQEYPSYKTVARYIRYLMDTKRLKNARLLAEGGEREYKRNVQLKGLRDTSAVPVMGIVQGDSHTFDFWVEYKDPDNGSVSAIRPTMVAWIDTKSRVVLGCVLAKTVNTQIVKQSMIKLVHEAGVPACILIDNGKDYTSKEMLGRNRKERNGLLVLDKEATGFYKSLGIIDDYRSLPYQPWSKGPIERFFGTVCNQFSRWFTSYTGTLTGSKTASKIEKDIPKLLKQGKLFTMNEVYELYNMWLQDTYHRKAHRGLKQMGEKWISPMELFLNAEKRIQIPPPPMELIETLLMKPGVAKVNQIGIQKYNQIYMNPALAQYIGTKVNIRWDPSDMSKIYAYDSDGKRICEAECQKLLGYQGYITEKQLVDHVKMQKKQLAEDKARLEGLRTPMELRGVEGAKAIAGNVDFMLENKKKKAIECNAEVVKEDIIKVSKGNEYFESKAQEALRKLNNLG